MRGKHGSFVSALWWNGIQTEVKVCGCRRQTLTNYTTCLSCYPLDLHSKNSVLSFLHWFTYDTIPRDLSTFHVSSPREFRKDAYVISASETGGRSFLSLILSGCSFQHRPGLHETSTILTGNRTGWTRTTRRWAETRRDGRRERALASLCSYGSVGKNC